MVAIPDFVANSAANGWWWMVLQGLIEPTEQAAYEYAARTIHDTVERLLRLSAERGITPRQAAAEIAIENTAALVEAYGGEEARAPRKAPAEAPA